MSHKVTLSLRQFLILLISLGLLPIALIGAWGIRASVSERQQELQRSMLALSRAVATAIDSELETTVENVQTLSNSLELREGDLAKFYATAQAAVRTQKDWRSVILTDAAGAVIFKTSLPYGTVVGAVIDPRSLEEVTKTLRPVIGTIAKGPLKLAAVPVRVPVMHNGRLQYVVTAALAPARVLRIINNQHLPEGWIISVQDAFGLRVARSLDHEKTVATGMSPTLVQLLKPGLTEGTGITQTLEGTEVLTSYTRLPRHPWTVVIGAPTAHFNDVLRHTLATYAVAILASLSLYVALAAFVSQRIVLSIARLRAQMTQLGLKRRVRRVHSWLTEVNEMGVDIFMASEELMQSEQQRESLLVSLQAALSRAEQASTTKDNFLAVLGHELRNPLAPIVTALDLMDMKEGMGSLRERQTMRRQVQHMSRLVDDLLDASRISKGKLAMHLEAVCLSAVVQQCVDAMRPVLALQGRRFHASIDEVWVTGDSTRLAQLVSNLLSNAVRYGGDGDVHVALRRENDEARLCVSDHGVGMDAATAAQIFELFFQAPQSSARTGGGLGLGLSIALKIVTMHNGTIQARSAGLGAGSQFEVTLAAIDAPAGAATAGLTGPELAVKRLMIVDDNIDAATTIGTLLSLIGHDVAVAHSGKAALELVRPGYPDVAILDIGLPDIDGFELAKALRRRGFTGTLVALTGYGQEDDKRRAFEAGFDVHLTKPANLDQLRLAIQHTRHGLAEPG
ncbi:MAG: response regulator [Pseudomonadota bacterium]|nr:response regulator [Pseudomonadota bacterium]